jgi:preprotein translocase subunit SecG
MFSIILLIFFIPICILLILIVLLQAGKGGGLAGAFGGGGGQTFLGARGAADFLSKLTVYLAIGFMLLALILSLTYAPQRNVNIKEKPAVTQGSDETATSAGETATEGTPAPQEESTQDTSQSETPSSDEGNTAPSPE